MPRLRLSRFRRPFFVLVALGIIVYNFRTPAPDSFDDDYDNDHDDATLPIPKDKASPGREWLSRIVVRNPAKQAVLEPTTPAAHIFRKDGLLIVDSRARHPIHDLILDAREKWAVKLSKQSKSLSAAVDEYKRRYGRLPPRGFDSWWKFVLANKVQLPDEYDQINHDIEPFFGVAPSDLQWLQEKWSEEMGTFTLSSQDGKVSISKAKFTDADTRMGLVRAEERLELVKDVEKWLPDFNATYTAHDSPFNFIGYDLRERALAAAKDGTYIDIDYPVDEDDIGWAAACAPNSPLRHSLSSAKAPTFESLHGTSSKSFIYDHFATMDPCVHTSHLHLNGILIAQRPTPKQYLTPVFGMSTSRLHADIQSPTLEHFRLEPDGIDHIEWDDKPDDRLIWRGRNTGLYASPGGLPWRQAQRQRLVDLLQTGKAKTDARNMYVLDPTSDAEDEPVGAPTRVKASELNLDLMDVAFGMEPIQCNGGICEEMEKQMTFLDRMKNQESYRYKYVLDVDGNGWSARFKRLMESKAVVLKSTIHPEWFSDRIAPWIHYVPVKVDLTDIYDIMTFFNGIRDGSDGKKRKGAHTAEAREIAQAGTRWSNTFWRREDMAAYTLRMFLEYARVMNEDRTSMDFVYDEQIHGNPKVAGAAPPNIIS